jgi:hypothetical protein
MSELTAAAPLAISGTFAILGALIGAYANARSANIETQRQRWTYQQKRRSERQKTYQTAIDLIADWGWRSDNESDYDVVHEFTIPFVRTANRVRVYGSPASVAAMDQIQNGFVSLNSAETEDALSAAYRAINDGLSQLVIAARADVGPRPDDSLEIVPFREGSGPLT